MLKKDQFQLDCFAQCFLYESQIFVVYFLLAVFNKKQNLLNIQQIHSHTQLSTKIQWLIDKIFENLDTSSLSDI